MQKKYTLQLSVLFMMVLFSTTLSAQEMRTQNDKKVVVTIRGKDAQGAKITNDNQASNKREKQGFLGVSQDDKDDENTEGVSVKITRNSGAYKAGLKEGDVLLQLNNATINTFHDISVFMRTTKPTDKIQVKYIRDGQTKSVTATLGQSEDAWSYKAQEKEACLGVYSSTYRQGTQVGSIIKDFTPISAAKESDMQLGDVITAVNGMTVKTHQEVWDEIAKYKRVQFKITRRNFLIYS